MRLELFKKSITYTLYVLAALLLFVFCLLFTIPGNQGIAWGINQFSSTLKIEHLNARFYDDEPFDVHYHREGNSVVLQAVQLKLLPHSLKEWTAALTAKQVLVTMQGSNTEPSSDNTEQDNEGSEAQAQDPSTSFMMHFDVSVDAISYQDTSNDVYVERLHAQGRFNDALIFDNIALNSVTLNVGQSQSSATVTDNVIPALVVPTQFPVPFTVNIAELQVKHIEVTSGNSTQKSQVIVESLTSSASLSKSSLDLDSFHFKAFERTFSMTAIATPTQLNSSISIIGENEHVTLVSDGPWHALGLKVQNIGKLPLNLSAKINLLEPYFPFSLEFNLPNWSEIPFVDGKQLSNLSIQSTLSGKLNAYSGNLEATSDVESLGVTHLSASYHGSLTDINFPELKIGTPIGNLVGLIAVDFSSSLHIQGNVQWSELQLDKFIDIPTQLAGETALVFSQQAEHWQIAVNKFSAEGTFAELPLTFNMTANVDDQLNVLLDSFLLTLDDSQIKMNGKLSDKLDFSGQWLFNLDQLGDTEVKAKGEGKFKVQGSRAKPKVNLDTHFETFQLHELTLDELKAKVEWGLTKSSDVLLSLSASKALVGQQQLSDIHFKLAGPIDNHRATAAMSHAQGKAELEFIGGLQDQQWQGRILKTTALFDNREFKQIKATPLLLSATGRFKLSPYCLAWDESQLCLEVSKPELQQTVHASADISELNVALLNKFLPANISMFGHASGLVKVSASDAGIESLSATMLQKDTSLLVMKNGVSYPLVLGTLSLEAQGKGNQLEVGISNNGSPLGRFGGMIKTELGQINPVLDSEFELHQLDLAYLDPLLTQVLNREFQFKGELNGKLKTSGLLRNPSVFGHLNITHLAAHNERSPLVLTDSNLAVTMNGKSLSLSGELNDAQAGMLELSGEASWQNTLAVDFNIRGKSFMLKPQEGIELKLDTDMQVMWSEGEAKLLGQVSVPYGRIVIKSLPEGAVAISDDQVFVDEAETEPESLPIKYKVNLNVNVLDDVKIDSFGLKSYLTGNLLLNKQNDTPIVGSGELSLLHGTFKAFGQDLIISKGQIGFSGALDKPYLHVNAIRNPENTANGVVAGVQLTGLAKAPKVALYSEPAMDQAQVLSYLLNGQPLNGGGETDKNVLLTNLLLSQSLNRSEGILQKVGGGLGLQDVNVGTKGSGEGTQVEVSGFLTPSVQVKYSVGVFDSLSEIAIRYQILSKLYVEITSGLYDSIDLLYRFDWGETEEAEEEKTKEEKKP